MLQFIKMVFDLCWSIMSIPLPISQNPPISFTIGENFIFFAIVGVFISNLIKNHKDGD